VQLWHCMIWRFVTRCAVGPERSPEGKLLHGVTQNSTPSPTPYWIVLWSMAEAMSNTAVGRGWRDVFGDCLPRPCWS
jgi:hypothetical protein